MVIARRCSPRATKTEVDIMAEHPNAALVRRAMQAMLTMNKIVIADLDRAAEGH